MTRYEFKTLKADALPSAEQLTELGADGWRLAAILRIPKAAPSPDWYAIYLEREVR